MKSSLNAITENPTWTKEPFGWDGCCGDCTPENHNSRASIRLPGLMLFLCLVSALLIVSSQVAFAQTTSKTPANGQVIVPDNSGDAFELYSGSYALLLGVWDYDAIGVLSQIPDELESVKEALEAHGFNVTLAYPEDEREFRQTVNDFIDKYGYNEKNRVLFFYSGHGFSHLDKGYLLMKGSQPVVLDSEDSLLSEDFQRNALPMRQMTTWAEDMQVKHAMFLFDSCFSGTIFSTRTAATSLSAVDFNVDAVDHQARVFITAGSATEEVPAKSDFVRAFVATISKQGSDADINRDGYVTGDEIGLFIKDNIQRLGKQTPQVGKYPPEYSKGDIVFEISPWTPEKPASILFSIDGVELTMEGEIRNQRDKERILTSAEQAFGIENIRFDSLVVSQEVGRERWTEGVIQSIDSLRYLERGMLRIENSELVVEGIVNHENKKKRLLASLDTDAALKRLTMSEAIDVVPMKSATVQYRVDDGRVEVSGVLQTEREKNQIINSVRRSFGEVATVSDRILVDKNTVSSNWIASVIEANNVLTNIRQGEFRVDSEAIVISGVINSSEELPVVEYVLAENFPKHSITNELEIKTLENSELQYQFGDGAVRITGKLSSPAQTEFAESVAHEVFGADKVDINVVESRGYEDSVWLDFASEIMPSLTALIGGSVSVSGQLFEIEGTVAKDLDKLRIVDALDKHLPSEFDVRQSIMIATDAQSTGARPVASEFRSQFNNGKVVLSGRLADADAVEKIVQLTKAIYGQKNVEDQIVVDDSATSADTWLPKLDNVLKSLIPVETGQLVINNSSSTLAGLVALEDDWRSVRLAMQLQAHGTIDIKDLRVRMPEATELESVTDIVATSKSPQTADRQQDAAKFSASDAMARYCAAFSPDAHQVEPTPAKTRGDFRVRGQPHARCDSWLGLTPEGKVTITAQYGKWNYIVAPDSDVEGWVYIEAFEKSLFKRIFGSSKE